MSRKKNAQRNIVFGVALRVYRILIPFVIRTVMIYTLGVEYLGLNSLFVSIIQVLNLAELGIGSAMVYSMYKPIAENDNKTLCALMALYRKTYRIIGFVIGMCGLGLIPFLKYLIKSDIPANINLYYLYILNLSITVASYWLFAYRNCLITANQRHDITSKVTIGVNTVQYIFQILTLVYLRDYYIYIIIELIGQVAINIIVAAFSKKMYPMLSPKGTVCKSELKEIKKRVYALVLSRIGGTILTSSDSIVISAFLGLLVLAKYQNYFLLITSVSAIIEVIFTSITATIGNSIVVETKEKNYEDFRKLTLITSFMISFGSTCFISMYQPFIRLWIGEKMLLSYQMVVLFSVYFIIYEFTRMFNLYKNAAGVWYEDRFRPLVSAVVNLILNIVFVKTIGLSGVLFSTIIALGLIEIPWLIINVFATIFPNDKKAEFISVYTKCGIYILCSLFLTSFTRYVPGSCFLQLIIGVIISLFISTIMFNVFFRKSDLFSETKNFVISMIKR